MTSFFLSTFTSEDQCSQIEDDNSYEKITTWQVLIFKF